jgi:origin recognition complex subunit 5
MLAIFAALYAEHGQRPEDLQPDLAVVSGDEDETEAWLKSSVELEARAARRRARKAELDEDWEDEVDHIAMSSRLWGLVSLLKLPC